MTDRKNERDSKPGSEKAMFEAIGKAAASSEKSDCYKKRKTDGGAIGLSYEGSINN